MRMITLLAAASMFFAVAGPGLAQNAMMKDGMRLDKMAPMSAADTKKIQSCHAMSHDMMMKNADCKMMMKMHPDMMKGDTMMKHGGMIK